jgi:AcrR family transcriptional regulator
MLTVGGNAGAGHEGQSRHDRILDAALKVFAQHGTSDATLQLIAETAGVSIGLVQHHFGSKDKLIEAVNAHAMSLIGSTMLIASQSGPGASSVTEIGRAVHLLLTEHLEVMDYLARVVASGSPTGAAIFEGMAAAGIEQWQRLVDNGAADPDIDVVWAALNPLVLTLGSIILRRHLDRHLPGPFISDEQLTRWENSVNTLIQQGQLRRE